MMARRSGRIINVASAAGLQAIETVSAYGVSKAALIRLTEALAAETLPYGIAVLAVNPGTLRTSMSDYVLTAPQVRERAPVVQQWFQQLFQEGGDTPIEQAVAFVLAVASGRADALSGCYLSVDDDLEALVTQAEAIQREARLTLRLRD
jgi:NAD(P)-dependent dehydrogenase (short-subunit alcohol dehydrogenase family)